MKKLIIAAFCVMTLALTGCMGMGSLNHNTLNQTQVVLQQNNYKVVKTVEGKTHSFYFLGMGGNSQQTMKENAVNNMFKNAELKDGQAIINISTTTAVRTVLGIYMERDVTAYGTVIEFTK